MKKYLAILLSLVLIFGAFPVFAAGSGVEAMGNFQGQLLTAGYDVKYDLVLHNHENSEQTILVVLAEYIGSTLEKAVPENVTLSAGQRFSKTYTMTDITEDITAVRAFVMNSSNNVQPLIRADELNKEYGSIYNDYAVYNTPSDVEEIDLGFDPGDQNEDGVTNQDNTSALEGRFAIWESMRTLHQKYIINGVSMLAYFETAPEEIYVSAYKQSDGSAHYPQSRTARVIDPNGKVVNYYDFTEDDAADAVVLKIPEYTGEPGIWTISYTAGNNNCDEVTIGIPNTPYYGIRGDMLMGMNRKTLTDANGNNRPWYIYVPETCVGYDAVLMFPMSKCGEPIGRHAALPTITKKDGSTWQELLRADGTYANSEPRLHASAMYTTFTESDANSVMRMELDWASTFGWSKGAYYWHGSNNFRFNGMYIAFSDGLPGLLCPTPEAAAFLKGGTAYSADGRLLGGKVQAAARDASVEIATYGELDVTAEFPDEIPAELKESDLFPVEALTTYNHSGIVGVNKMIAAQNVNPDDIYLGSSEVTEFEATSKHSHRDNFESFTYANGSRDIYSAANLASAVALPTKLNGVYGDTGLVNRAALSLLSHIVEMSPENLIRDRGLNAIKRDEEGNITNTSYGDYWPCDRAFFTFPNICQAYSLLKDKVSPEVSEVMKNAVILIGDKMSNYMANDTNQWSEAMMAHMEIYMATGEERFLHYFERMAAAFGNKPIDVNSMGQNDAGAYLERMAPSAQYGNQNTHNILPCYYIYRSLPNHDPEVLAKFEDSISRYVNWESLNWMPVNPGGPNLSATAIMVKGKNGSYNLGGGTYPNGGYTSIGFPIVRTLFDMKKDSFTTATAAELLYESPEIAEELVQTVLIDKADPLSAGGGTNYSGTRSYEIITQEERVEGNQTLPIFETDRVWKYDDVLVWKKNGLYTQTFYANPHSVSPAISSEAAMSHRGGLPFAVWSEGTGPVVMSQYTNFSHIGFVDTGEIPVYSGVFVTMADGETVINTGKVNSTITEMTDTGYTITQPLGLATVTVGEGDAAVKVPKYGTLTYKVTYTSTGCKIDVSLETTEASENYTDAHIELPICRYRTGNYYASKDTGTLHSVITQSNGNKTFNYKSTLAGSYGSMNIHSSTAATFDETKYYGSWANNAIQKLLIPLDEAGNATITFEIVND